MLDIMQMLDSAVQYFRQNYLHVVKHAPGAVGSGELKDGRSLLHLAHSEQIVFTVSLIFVKTKFQKSFELRDEKDVIY